METITYTHQMTHTHVSLVVLKGIPFLYLQVCSVISCATCICICVHLDFVHRAYSHNGVHKPTALLMSNLRKSHNDMVCLPDGEAEKHNMQTHNTA